jgi:hypothetical protein
MSLFLSLSLSPSLPLSLSPSLPLSLSPYLPVKSMSYHLIKEDLSLIQCSTNCSTTAALDRSCSSKAEFPFYLIPTIDFAILS